MNKQALLDLQSEIEESKIKVEQLKGKKIALMEQLKKDYDCDTIVEAEAKLAKIDKKVERVKKQIEEGTITLQEKYELN